MKEELIEKRKSVKTFDDLVAFLKDVRENYNVSYEDSPIAIAQACLSVAWFLTGKFGITNWQASFVMWEFILGYIKTSLKTSLKLVDYDDMLYPQYAHKFEKKISQETWELIQKSAREMLEEVDEKKDHVCENVLSHWKSIVDGKVPFGFTVEKGW